MRWRREEALKKDIIKTWLHLLLPALIIMKPTKFIFSRTLKLIREKKSGPQLTCHMFGWNKRNLQPMISPPLVAPMPTRPPVSGGYGRLDSPWRVRSHLKTLGQPKAGTVTITQPQSLTKHAEKNSHRRDLTGEVVGLRWRRIWVIIRDEQKHKSTLFHSGGPLWPRTGIWSSVNGVESSTKTLNLHLMRICLQLVEIQFCTKWVKRQLKTSFFTFLMAVAKKKKERSTRKQRLLTVQKDFPLLFNLRLGAKLN